MVQIEPERPYSDALVDRVVEYLQTRNPALFPFAARFDEHKQAAFMRDLREGLGHINDSGSARKTSATGFIASDEPLRRVIDEWEEAAGAWPEGSFPEDPVTALGSSTAEDSPGTRVYAARIVRGMD